MNWEEIDFSQEVIKVSKKIRNFDGVQLPFIGLEHIEKETLTLAGIGSVLEINSDKTLFQPEDVLFGTLRPYFRKVYRPKFDGVCSTDITVLRAKQNSEVDQRFLFYFIANKPFIDYASSFAKDQRPRVNWKDVVRKKFKIPLLPTQRKIASTLSAYDDLIENNLKRIKLLEEKAKLHYKVLMQEMSFTKIKREEFVKDCLAYYIGGGWGEEEYKEKFTESAHVIRGTDIPDVRGGNISGVPLRFHKEGNLESRKLQAGDIVFEVSNGQIRNIGRTVLATDRLLGQFNHPVMCASFAKQIRVNEKVSPEFFYLYLNEGQENGLLYQYKSNSANGINNFAFETFIDEVKISLPKENEMKSFTEKVKPIFTLISTLGEQNSKLREARDILLPRLMSGEIEV